ncbi:histidine kinase [Terrimonas sp. NA20]|uniref:Histidine kinase n=1 Tax=Terrimonas ginsenosidimutans TaxID=2908004 RepID=A0ABS9KZR4_9BACT|nr:histidine kinase [Terrimonas ginsenosidimutans]MCG2617825.1 histidine kinase [Terrimonas ginsenosidimutans]
MQRSWILKYKLHHLIFWMLIFGAWYFLRHQDYSRAATAFKVTLIKVLDLALMVYITNYLLIPRLLYRKKYVTFTSVFILMIVTSSFLKMLILAKVMNAPAMLSFSQNLKTRIYDNVIPHFFLVTAGAAIQLMIDYFRLQKRMAEIAKERAEAELNFLKSQINPHFLFNSINSVYFLIDKQNKEARESLHKFSDMLRYQLYEMNGSRVPIEKELRYLQDYFHLQKLRKDELYEVSFNHSASLRHFTIEPMLLIPFIENAFKHVSAYSDQPNLIHIDLDHKDHWLIFKIENTTENRIVTDPHSGIGLKNVRRRLELLYPASHALTIQRKGDRFVVELRLQTDQSPNLQKTLL